MSRPESERLLESLVGFDTTSDRSNLPLIHFVQHYLAGHGVASRLIEDRAQPKAGLLATIGPADRQGLLLAGHTDVVPVNEDSWTTAPFHLDRRQSRLFGRGSADMKGFIASMLAAVPRFLNRPLRMPVHLALTYDEEIGCAGARPLLEVLNRLPARPAMGIVGEPTSMRVVTGHKGKAAFAVHVRGRECHSSNPAAGVNAIEAAAELITFIRRLHQDKRRTGPFDERFEVPHTTLHVGTIKGGSSLNIVPGACTFEFEVRHLPEESPHPLLDHIQQFATDHLLPSMKAIDPAADIRFEARASYPGLYTAEDAEVVTFVQSLVDEREPPGTIGFGTEAGLYQQVCGIPMVVCGPGRIADAHRPDESIGTDDLASCDAFFDRLATAVTN